MSLHISALEELLMLWSITRSSSESILFPRLKRLSCAVCEVIDFAEYAHGFPTTVFSLSTRTNYIPRDPSLKKLKLQRSNPVKMKSTLFDKSTECQNSSRAKCGFKVLTVVTCRVDNQPLPVPPAFLCEKCDMETSCHPMWRRMPS